MKPAYIYAARPRGLNRFFVGFTRSDCGAFSAFANQLPRLYHDNQHIAELPERFRSPQEWEVILLEVDDFFEGPRATLEERKRFYIQWLRDKYNAFVMNSVMGIAMTPRWGSSWSILDSKPML